MIDTSDLDALTRKLQRLAAGFDGPTKVRVLKKIDKPLQADVEKAVRTDLGDLSMSGWRRGRPVPIIPTARVRTDGIAVSPAGRAIGPMRTLSEGRNGGGGFQGPGVNARTGATKRTKKGNLARVRARRNNGTTRGKGTWTDAVRLMQDTAPKVLRKAVIDEVGEVFRGK